MITRLDYECPACGAVYRNLLAPSGTKVYCYDPACAAAPLEILWTTGRAEDFGFSSHDVGAMTVSYDEDSPKRGKQVTLSSISEIRAFERECERMAADGVHSPRVFRAYAQDHSNRTQNVFRHLQPDQEVPKRPDGSAYVRVAGGQSIEHVAPDEPAALVRGA